MTKTLGMDSVLRAEKGRWHNFDSNTKFWNITNILCNFGMPGHVHRD